MILFEIWEGLWVFGKYWQSGYKYRLSFYFFPVSSQVAFDTFRTFICRLSVYCFTCLPSFVPGASQNHKLSIIISTTTTHHNTIPSAAPHITIHNNTTHDDTSSHSNIASSADAADQTADQTEYNETQNGTTSAASSTVSTTEEPQSALAGTNANRQNVIKPIYAGVVVPYFAKPMGLHSISAGVNNPKVHSNLFLDHRCTFGFVLSSIRNCDSEQVRGSNKLKKLHIRKSFLTKLEIFMF